MPRDISLTLQKPLKDSEHSPAGSEPEPMLTLNLQCLSSLLWATLTETCFSGEHWVRTQTSECNYMALFCPPLNGDFPEAVSIFRLDQAGGGCEALCLDMLEAGSPMQT